MKAKLQALRIRPPQPHGNLADLAANAVRDKTGVRITLDRDRVSAYGGVRSDGRTSVRDTCRPKPVRPPFLAELARFENSRNLEPIGYSVLKHLR